MLILQQEDNEAFLAEDLMTEDEMEESSDCDSEREQDDHESFPKKPQRGRQNVSWNDSSTFKAKNKLIRIFNGETTIPQQRWTLWKPLSVMVGNRKDPALRTTFRQFRRFSHETMMIKTR